MRQQIADLVENHWKSRLPGLMRLVGERTRQIENLLTLEEFHRGGRRPDTLGKAMSGFGASSLDMGSLSEMLVRGEGGSRTMDKERHHRIKTLFGKLEKLRASLEADPPNCRFLELGGGAQAALEAFDDQAAELAKTFRTLRIAQFEAGAQYDPEEHTAFFEKFNWRHLNNEEMALCPPVVVFSEGEAQPGEDLPEILRLLTGGRPVKLVLLRRRLDNTVAETGRAAALKSAGGQELLFISLRNIFVLQGSPAGPTPLQELMGRGLDSPRPGMFSIYAGSAGQNGTDRQARALASRAFPHFVYDPERAADFVSCLDLSENPSPEEAWATGKVEHVNDEGEAEELEYPLTFADFAAGEPELKDHFTPLAEDAAADSVIPLADYLAFPSEKRRDTTPYIHALDGNKRLTRLVPSHSIIAQTADRMHLWRTLQELGGIRNPFVQAAEEQAVARLSSEKEASLAELKTQMEGQIAAREQEAVAAAMRNLALKLTGLAPLDGGAAPLAAPSAPPASQAGGEPAPAPAPPAAGAEPATEAAPEEAAGPVSEMPWIETKLCTTCDECIAINKKIFAYNSDKKAVIKDPRGGPYRDIVKAAEKCSSGAIHPGMPLDPNEKDLEKWIKRAEPYQ